MEFCDCTDRITWTTSVGAVKCLHCARLDPTVKQPDCSHERCKITSAGSVCVTCHFVFPLLSAFKAFQQQGLTK